METMGAPMNFVFLHGGGQGSWVWAETIAALRLQAGDAIRTLALDVPGCGQKRGRNIGNLTFHSVGEELIADVEAADMRNVVLVGHSQAGTVLPAMLERRPELFHRAIYVSCSMPLPGQTVLQMIGKDVHGSNPDEVGWPVDPATSKPRERTQIMLCNDMDSGKTESFMAKLGQDQWPPSSYTANRWQFFNLGKVPASYVACLQDNILPMAWQETFAQRFHAERLVRIDAGHQVMNTRPHALAEVLLHEAKLEK